MQSWKAPINKMDIKPVINPPGIARRALAYNKEGMMCHFTMEKGAKIPLHNHKHVQIGYVICGEIKFFTETGEFIAKTGDSYVFNEFEKHGADLIQNTEAIEVFVPCRDEYKPTD